MQRFLKKRKQNFSEWHDKDCSSLLLADTRICLSTARVSLTLVPLGPAQVDFQVGGIESGLKPAPSPLAPKLRAAHAYRCMSECLCGRGVHRKVKIQPTSSLKRRRGEQRAGCCLWVWNGINTANSKQHDSMPALFSHFSCKEHVYDVFISCHRLMSINLNSSSSHFPKTLYFNECHKVSITAHGSQCLPFISDAK